MKGRRGRSFSFPHSSFSRFLFFPFFFCEFIAIILVFFLFNSLFFDFCILFLSNFPRISLTSIFSPFLSRFFPLVSPICSSAPLRRQKRRREREEKKRKKRLIIGLHLAYSSFRSQVGWRSISSAREWGDDYIVLFHESVRPGFHR